VTTKTEDKDADSDVVGGCSCGAQFTDMDDAHEHHNVCPLPELGEVRSADDLIAEAAGLLRKRAAFQLIPFLEREMMLMLDIARRKNADYAGEGFDPFANFTRVEVLGIATTEQGFLTRMTDKLCRINNILKSGKTHVKDESVKDTLRDLANYSMLLVAYLEWKRLATEAGI